MDKPQGQSNIPFKVEFNNNELAQYLEAMAGDIKQALDKVSGLIMKTRSLDLNMPKGFTNDLGVLSSNLRRLSEKNFDQKIDMPDFSAVRDSINQLENTISSLKFPSEVSLKKMPDIKFPETKIDLKTLENAIFDLKKTLLETPLRAELTNLDEMPMVLSQHAAKNLAEANPIVHNLTLTIGGQEYSQAINGPTKGFIMQGTGDYNIQVRFSATGNYWTIKAGSALEIGGYNEIVYAKSATALAVLEIIEIH